MSEAFAPAGLIRRFGAIAYDTLILAAVLILATALTMPFTGGIAVEPGTRWYQIYLAIVVLSYFSGFWSLRGQTIGMVAWHLFVQDDKGGKLRWWQSLLRALTALLSWSALGLGFLWALYDKRNRSWHDLLSQTRLVVGAPRR